MNDNLFNLLAHRFITAIFTPDRRQSKTLILSRNVDQKSLEMEKLRQMATKNTVSSNF